MTKEHYLKLMSYFPQGSLRLKILNVLNSNLTRISGCCYCFLLLSLMVKKDGRFFRTAAIPLFVFASVSLVRNWVNLPRPYDVLQFRPILFYKPGKGESFPSRHTACGFIIAFAFLYVNIFLGIFFLIIAFCIGLIRLVGGVHYPRDILAGSIYSFIAAVIGFWIIP